MRRQQMEVGTSSQSGFSLVELLVVIGIIGVLMALLVPAVQAARQTARRVQCQNSMKQIALAVANYESTHGHLPPGHTPLAADRASGLSWLAYILPHIEQGNRWKQAMEDYNNAPSPFTHRGFSTVISTYVCPANPFTGQVHLTRNRYIVGTTDYMGVNGTSFDKQDGVLFLDSAVEFAEVSDGLSNTLLVGERPPSQDYWYGWWYTGEGLEGSGATDNLLGAREKAPSTDPELGGCDSSGLRPSVDGLCDALHFWSYHPGGANFAFCDGSVRLVSYDQDDLLPALATRAGGESFESPE